MNPITLIRDGMAGKSLRTYADELGVSAAYLSDILNDKRAAGPKVLKALGLERLKVTTVTYRSKGKPKREKK